MQIVALKQFDLIASILHETCHDSFKADSHDQCDQIKIAKCL